jgi:transcriptional regulator with XRE-family HTH domain
MTDAGHSPDPVPLPSALADERFAVNSRERRQQLGLTQADIARQMAGRGWSYHPQTVQRIEAGDRKVSIGEAQELARILRTTTDALTSSPQSALERRRADIAMRLERATMRLATIRADEAATEKDRAALADELEALSAALTEAAAAEDARGGRERRWARVITLVPLAAYDPRPAIAGALREGNAVVLDLNEAKDAGREDADRIAEFAAGVALGLGGSAEWLGSDGLLARILVLAPAEILVSPEDLARIEVAAYEVIQDDGDPDPARVRAATAAASRAWRKILSGDESNGG